MCGAVSAGHLRSERIEQDWSGSLKTLVIIFWSIVALLVAANTGLAFLDSTSGLAVIKHTGLCGAKNPPSLCVVSLARAHKLQEAIIESSPLPCLSPCSPPIVLSTALALWRALLWSCVYLSAHICLRYNRFRAKSCQIFAPTRAPLRVRFFRFYRLPAIIANATKHCHIVASSATRIVNAWGDLQDLWDFLIKTPL